MKYSKKAIIEVTSMDSGKTERMTRAEFDKRFGVEEGKEILAGYAPHIVAVEV